MSIYTRSLTRIVKQTTSDSPERWLERLRRLKRDPLLLEQLGPVPQSRRGMRAEPPNRWQVRLALLKQDPRLVERFGAFYRQLASLPRRARRWLMRKAALTLTAAALLLALSGTPLVHAAGFTVTTTDPNIAADGQCSLIEAIDNANADAQIHSDCPAGSGADVISLPANSVITLTSVNNSIVIGLPQITSAITIEGNGATIARQSGAPPFRIFAVTHIGNLILNNTTVSGGSSSHFIGGGIFNEGTLTLNNSTVSGNNSSRGGGIANWGNATLNNSTVSGNGYGFGAGIYNRSMMTLNNSTVSGNSGTGLANDGTMTLNNSTVSGNTDNGIWNDRYFATLNLVRSVVSGNAGLEIVNDYYSYYGTIYYTGIVNSNNFNLIGHDGNAGTVNFTPSGSDIVPSQPLSAILAPLADNGGPTQTHALVAGSPAVDAAPTGPAADQRGVSRPQGSAFDIGAFELEQAAPDTIAPTILLTTPAEGAVFTLGQAVNADYACQDEEGGSGLASCVGSVANGSLIDTSSVGTKSFTVNAADNAGNPASVTHNYSVVYNFNGFFQPVDNLPTFNTVKAGRAIPVKFSLGGDQGLAIFAEGYPVSQQVACEGGAPVDAIEQTVTAGGSSLSYDPVKDTYTYVWKTNSAWKGQCRTLIVKLSDGTEHTANFKFK